MDAIDWPAVPYDASAARPAWEQLPAAVRAAVSSRLGAPVLTATTAGGGFTRGFAGVLTLADGNRVFVKAASLTDQAHLADWYAREAAITAALPPRVPAARPRWTLLAAGWFALCLDAVDGRLPALPWRPAELSAALDAWALAADELRQPPAALLGLGLPTLPDLLRTDLSWWAAVRARRVPMPPAAQSAATRLDELAELEGALPGYAAGAGVIHCDLRVDNVLIDADGRAWLCDWNWPCHGQPWFDTAALLVTAYASGLDADALFAGHPTARDAPADALDATLAALSGYWLYRAGTGGGDAAGHLAAHQRFSGRTALAWLAARRGWSRPGSARGVLPAPPTPC